VGSPSSCPSGSVAFTRTPVVGERVHVPLLTRPSILEAEATMAQVAKGVMNDPHLFSFKVTFDYSSPQRGPDNSEFAMFADYESPCDQVHYLSVLRWRNLQNYPEDLAHIGEAPFLPPYSCWGNPPAVLPVENPDPEPESKHPPIDGWTVDLPQILSIAKSRDALFANGLDRWTITTAARLRENDSRPQCGSFTVFNPPDSWNGAVTSSMSKRLLNGPGQQAVIELVEHALDTTQPGSSMKNKNCGKGHYLIIDAGSGADLESGTYLYCLTPPA